MRIRLSMDAEFRAALIVIVIKVLKLAPKLKSSALAQIRVTKTRRNYAKKRY
jgi:hypothetical protein